MTPEKRNLVDYMIYYPLSLLYGFVTYVRNKMFDFNILPSHEFGIPVISVGNISVGGTGKTPHIEYLISLLKDEYNIATLSRGYKRKTSGFLEASENSTAQEVGDEPLQIKRKYPDTTVAVNSSRVEGINKLLKKEEKLNAVLLDDAFQHRHVKPGISILLIDYNRPITQDHMLPYGRLRESAYERKRANIILITKCPDRMKPIERRIIRKELNLFPYQTLHFTRLTYGSLMPVFPEAADNRGREDYKKIKPWVLLITGIASPRPFKRHVRGISTRIREMNYPDHHAFSDKDIKTIQENFNAMGDEQHEKIVITTEKDAMRLKQFDNLDEQIKKVLYYIPVKVKFLDNEESKFNKHIINYVRNNKTYSVLHK